MKFLSGKQHPGWWLLLAAMLLTVAVYAPGLSGHWLFDDYPNIVNNEEVQPDDASIGSLAGAALSSPASRFKRPLASLSFAANYLAGGLDPFGWKLTNLVIHLLNGLLVFLLARMLLLRVGLNRSHRHAAAPRSRHSGAAEGGTRNPLVAAMLLEPAYGAREAGIVAALVAGAWMLLPINLSAVLYVVQRMESMANFFVLLGLIGYVAGRTRMLKGRPRAFMLCIASLIVPTMLGLLAKETAVMLPLYALLIEWIMFRFEVVGGRGARGEGRGTGVAGEGRGRAMTPGTSETAPSPVIPDAAQRRSGIHLSRGGTRWIADRVVRLVGTIDRRIVVLFLVVLVAPMIVGLAQVLPRVFEAATWARRDFTLVTRLLSEARIIVDYIGWTLLPLPESLSFYHDQFHISTGLLSPWTTLAGIVVIAGLIALVFWLRHRAPLAALGLALYFGGHLLTGTVLNLELIYEHRNYFASFGLLLAIVPPLAAPLRALPMVLARRTLLATLVLWWAVMTTVTAYAWGDQLRLALELAARAPDSPRAQYELGRTYIIYSNYDPASPFTELAYAPLERAAALPNASILPEQALIMMNSRMGVPVKDAWWVSMIAKLKSEKTGVQDESSLGALTKCAVNDDCILPPQRMVAAYLAALSHPNPSARLHATYADYLWNNVHDYASALHQGELASAADPDEPAYHVTLARMYLVLQQPNKVRQQITELERLNYGGRLDTGIAELRALQKSRAGP